MASLFDQQRKSPADASAPTTFPTLPEFLTYGPGAFLAASNRAAGAERTAAKVDARERLEALLELQSLGAATPSIPGGEDGRFTLDMPAAPAGAATQMNMLRTLDDAGYSAGDLSAVSESAVDAARAKFFAPTYQGLEPAQRADFVNDLSVAPVAANGGMTFNRYNPQGAILDESSAVEAQARQREADALFKETQTGALTGALSQIQDPARLAEVASGRSIAPVKASGGVLYSPYNEADPLLAESSAVSGLGSLRAAQASGENTRNDVLGEVFEAPGVSPLVAADVANRNTVSKPERVAIRGKDGTTTYANAIRTPAGGYRYMEATDEAGAPVQPPPEGYAPGSTEKNTMFVAQALGLSPGDALRWQKQLGTYSAPRAWEELTQRVVSSDYTGSIAKKPDALRERVLAIWQVARPGEPPPENMPVPGEAPPSRSATQAGGQEDPVYAEARAAIARGAPAEAVRARLQQMGFDPRQL